MLGGNSWASKGLNGSGICADVNIQNAARSFAVASRGLNIVQTHTSKRNIERGKNDVNRWARWIMAGTQRAIIALIIIAILKLIAQ